MRTRLNHWTASLDQGAAVFGTTPRGQLDGNRACAQPCSPILDWALATERSCTHIRGLTHRIGQDGTGQAKGDGAGWGRVGRNVIRLDVADRSREGRGETGHGWRP